MEHPNSFYLFFKLWSLQNQIFDRSSKEDEWSYSDEKCKLGKKEISKD